MKALRFVGLAVSLFAGAASANIPSRLTVVVFDHAHVPHTVLTSAAHEGQRALRVAGVETDWILCNPVAGCSVPERFIQIKILPHPLPTTPISAYGLASATACTATEHCAASHVFYDRVLRFSDDTGASADLTLAYVMLHEIGHVMGLSHRPGGIMTAAFTSRDLHRASTGWLTFADEDTAALRTIAARSYINADPRHIRLTGWRGDSAE
jgi:hypothetical protein